MKTIGVFDSGVGGKSVADAVRKAMPQYAIIYREDSKNVPYGNKTKSELYNLVLPILKEMENTCDVIIIACNTVSTNIIGELRTEISVPLIAMEPMIKPASLATKSKIIAVCATPRTLASERYLQLIAEYAQHITVLEPDCSNWSYMIEENAINRDEIKQIIDEVCNKGADVIVLGCTHYHWIEDEIRKFAKGRAKVLQPEQAVIRQLQKVLLQLD